MAGDDVTDLPTHSKYKLNTSTFRTVYTTAYREMMNDNNVQNIAQTIHDFSTTTDITELNRHALTLESTQLFLNRKLNILTNQYQQWHAMLVTITDEEDRTKECETMYQYFNDPDENNVNRDPVYLRATYSAITNEIEECLKVLKKRRAIVKDLRDEEIDMIQREEIRRLKIVHPPAHAADPVPGTSQDGDQLNNPGNNTANNEAVDPNNSPSVTQSLQPNPGLHLDPLTTVPTDHGDALGSTHRTLADNMDFSPQASPPYSNLHSRAAGDTPDGPRERNRTINPSHSPHNPMNHTMNPPMQRLPNIELPKFGGDVTQFNVWWERFSELVHTRTDISDIDKFAHLHACLTGDARTLVNAYEQLGRNYGPAVNALCSRYNQERTFRLTMQQKLEDIKATSDKPSDQSILLNRIRAILTQLSHTDDVQNSGILQNMILRKFNDDVMLHVAQHMNAVNYSTTELLDTIERYLSNLNFYEQLRVKRTNTPQNDINLNGRHQRPPNLNSPTYRTSNQSPPVNQSSTPRSTPRQECPFCAKNHSNPEKCNTVKTIDERNRVIRDKNLCRKCLKTGHLAKDCTFKCTSCDGHHHKAICQTSRDTSNHVSVGPEKVRLMTSVVTVENPLNGKRMKCNALLDSGSTVTLMCKSIAENLGFDLKNVQHTSLNLVGERTIERDFPIIDPKIVIGKKKIGFQALVKDDPLTIPLPLNELSADDMMVVKRYNRFMNHTEMNESVLPTILFGITVYDQVMTGNHTVLPSGYILRSSKLGPIVSGGQSAPTGVINHLCDDPNELDSSYDLKQFLAIEQTACDGSSEREQRELIDRDVEKHFMDTVAYENGEYVVKYFLNEHISDLPDNFEMAFSRLKSLHRSLSKNRTHLEFYNSLIQAQLESGQIEEVTHLMKDSPIHYIPHQSVERPDKPTTPLRIVFDASAKKKNSVSLNDVIERGPNLNEQIPSILLRARSKKNLMVADVEKAFLQIRLHPDQRDLLRFLWLRELDKGPIKDNIVIFRFCVTPFGVNQSPYLLNRVIRYHLEGIQATNDIPRQIITSIYVDNVVLPSDEPDFSFYDDSKRMFKDMHMNLREYVSTSRELNDKIPECDRGDPHKQKLFGIKWDPYKDLIEVKIPQLPDKATKRSILSFTASIFDPLGLIAPLTFPLKIFLQNLWSREYGWDDILKDEDAESWRKIADGLQKSVYSFPRYTPLSDKIHLFLFTDASKKGRGAVVYTRDEHGERHILMSRNSIIDKDSKITVPKLEIDALLIGYKLIQYVVNSLRKIHTADIIIHPFCDSTTVIHWMTQDKEYHLGPYIGSRCRKIQKITSELMEHRVRFCPVQYVDTRDNPSDHLTRGLSTSEIDDSTWWKGPNWLQDWKDQPENHSLHYPVYKDDTVTRLGTMNVNRFSMLDQAVTVIGYVQRFISNCRSKRLNTVRCSSNFLLANERKRAYRTLIRLYQSDTIPDVESSVRNELFEDNEGIWRRMSRMDNSDLPELSHSPIFLPKSDSHLLTLIIRDVHEKVKHSGVGATLNDMKMTYNSPSIRNRVKLVLKDCIPCRRINNRPYKYHNPPQLPISRVKSARPFSQCGMDFVGPFSGSNNQKHYALLFTCLTTRMIHIEPVQHMDQVATMHALERFVSRRGCPQNMLSDCAPVFKSTSTLIDSIPMQDDDLVNTFLAKSGIEFSFTTAHAPWKGACYERMIKDVKRSIYHSLGRKKVDFDRFSTVIIAAEAVHNCRPLTYVPSDSLEFMHSRVIRPIDFLIPNGFLGLNTVAHSDGEGEDYKPPGEMRLNDVINRLTESHEKIDRFWNEWSKSYLHMLRDRPIKSALNSYGHAENQPQIGEIVLVIDESGNTPRSTWQLARILEINGTSAKLMNSTTRRMIERPINLLIPLEIRATGEVPIAVQNDSDTTPTHPMITRSKQH